MQTIQEIYSTAILPLSEEERLRLAEMIVRDIRGKRGEGANANSIRPMFGTWHGKPPASSEGDEPDHNARIDADLARSYMDSHDNED